MSASKGRHSGPSGGHETDYSDRANQSQRAADIADHLIREAQRQAEQEGQQE